MVIIVPCSTSFLAQCVHQPLTLIQRTIHIPLYDANIGTPNAAIFSTSDCLKSNQLFCVITIQWMTQPYPFSSVSSSAFIPFHYYAQFRQSHLFASVPFSPFWNSACHIMVRIKHPTCFPTHKAAISILGATAMSYNSRLSQTSSRAATRPCFYGWRLSYCSIRMPLPFNDLLWVTVWLKVHVEQSACCCITTYSCTYDRDLVFPYAHPYYSYITPSSPPQMDLYSLSSLYFVSSIVIFQLQWTIIGFWMFYMHDTRLLVSQRRNPRDLTI